MTNEILKMDNVKIIFRNFSGLPTKFKRDGGDRSFAVVIDDVDDATRLAEDGWNVKIKEPREEGDRPFCYLTVKVKFNKDIPRLNPKIYMMVNGRMITLDEESIDTLDKIEISNVDLDIKPRNYDDVNGRSGVSAYLTSICVTQEVDRFQQRYAEEESPEDDRSYR